MSTTAEIDQLRARARSIRRTADAVAACSASKLSQRAGPDTWIGPTPARCLADLESIRSTLTNASADLLVAAASLERRADALAAARSTVRVVVS